MQQQGCLQQQQKRATCCASREQTWAPMQLLAAASVHKNLVPRLDTSPCCSPCALPYAAIACCLQLHSLLLWGSVHSSLLLTPGLQLAYTPIQLVPRPPILSSLLPQGQLRRRPDSLQSQQGSTL